MSIEGTCDVQFQEVYRVFQSSFGENVDDVSTELGAAISVVYRGRKVVDLWGGFLDEAKLRPWSKDSTVCVQSVGKGIVATCALLLMDRGSLDVDRPISYYWPEFGQRGKKELPVRWALSHQLGMPAWSAPEPGMGYDWEWATRALAETTPDLRPGKDNTYHPYTYGFLVGEVIQRIADKTIAEFLREEITSKLDIDFTFGASREQPDNIATFTKLRHGDNVAGGEAGATEGFGDVMRRSLDVLDHDEDYNSARWREAVIPAANGHTNARALARLYTMLAQGGDLDGVRIVSPEAIDRATELQWGGDDLIIPANTNVALGFMLNSPSYPAGPNPRSFGHAGMGGAYGFADQENQLAFGYTPNKIWLGTKVETGRRCEALVNAVYKCLSK